MNDVYKQDTRHVLQIRNFWTQRHEPHARQALLSYAGRLVHDRDGMDIVSGHYCRRMSRSSCRPQWDEELAEIARQAPKTGVFFCGPDRMARAVDKTCRRISQLPDHGYLKFHKEVF